MKETSILFLSHGSPSRISWISACSGPPRSPQVKKENWDIVHIWDWWPWDWTRWQQNPSSFTGTCGLWWSSGKKSTGSIPGPGRSHMPWTNEAQAPQQEKAPQREDCALQRESSPCSPQLEKSPSSNEDPAQSKVNKYMKVFKGRIGNFPGGLVVKILWSQCQGPRFNPWSGN